MPLDPKIHLAPELGPCPTCEPPPKPAPSVARDIGLAVLMDPGSYVRGVLPAMTEEEKWFRARPDHPFEEPPDGMKVRICYRVLKQLWPDGAEICGGLEGEHPSC